MSVRAVYIEQTRELKIYVTDTNGREINTVWYKDIDLEIEMDTDDE